MADDGSVLILDSKQMKNMATKVEMNAAGGFPQMSDGWVVQVLKNLNNAARQVTDPLLKAELMKILNTVEAARDSGNFSAAIIAVDKSSKELIAVPVKVGK
ncbi:hypothetical protein [Chitinibacter tainanensis]|uniref:hypothetical protein n=1 Tax=Chitinibacter tainanensis TaxID=230667 RepID=UPI00048DD83A|nr:hypothetical protein [Chitinibacter tainanensis]